MTDTKKPRKPLKRTELRRKTAMKRGKPISSSRSSGTRTGMPRRQSKPIAKVNPERQKRVAKQGAAKHRAYMASQTRRDVEARSGGVCEMIITPNPFSVTQFEPFRCENPATDHHHTRYALRYGGNELPEDMLHLCERCHDYLESLKPAGNRRKRAMSARSQGGDSR